MVDVEGDPALRFVVLGHIQVLHGGVEVDLGPRQQQQLLALLLLRAGAPGEVDEIVDALWGGHPPVSAANLVHRNVGHLRRVFEPGLPPRAMGAG
jgi:DNA-binding SARP family transcriptional activator